MTARAAGARRRVKSSKSRHLLAFLLLALGTLPVAAHGPADYAELYKEVSKSVVEIYDAETGQEVGTGVITSSDGYMLTNAHVIYDYENDEVIEPTVSLLNGSKAEARVLGYDHYSDIALLKADFDEQLTAAKIGDSEKLEVGDAVLVIGHPHRFDYSLSSGVVSYLNRLVAAGSAECSTPFIQTDAASNPGNSGGPLLNALGEVVGIISWGRPDETFGSGTIGIEFAVPINLAMQVQEELRESNTVRWGMLGLYLDDELLSVTNNNGDNVSGFRINKVNEGSGAEAAGLETGDVIVEYSYMQVENLNDFPCLMAGKEVPVKLIRDGQELDFRVTLGAIEDGGRVAVLN